MLNIDELRKIAVRKVVYHPLGAIRLTFGKNFENVYHFYSDKTPMLSADNIHTHPYSFKSTIIKGGVRNHVYHWEESNEPTKHCMMRKECRAGETWNFEHSNVTYNKVLTFDTYENNSYTIDYTVMHKIELLAPKVISLLEKSAVMQEPTFILPQDKLYTEEELFDLKPEDECWEIIKYTLQ
jgi:hypothetical protein